jgi:hypothetical protein
MHQVITLCTHRSKRNKTAADIRAIEAVNQYWKQRATAQAPILPNHYYMLRMKGEKDFGGRVKIDSVSKRKITCHFEFKNWVDDFRLQLTIKPSGAIHYAPTDRDAFTAEAVTLKPCK